MEPRIAPIKGGFAAVGDGWAVVARSESQVRDLFDEAIERHAAIEARPDPHPVPIEPQRPSWLSQPAAQD